MFLNVLVLVLFTLSLQNVIALNVLGIFEIPSKSLHILGYELLMGLASKGHNVTLMSSFPMETKTPNFTHVYIEGLLEYKEENLEDHIQGESKVGMIQMINVQVNLVDLAMQSKGLKEFLKTDSKYDVIIQTYALNEGYLALAHHFDARVIGFVPFSSFPHITALTGNSAPYSYVGLPLLGFKQEMTFLQRTLNTLIGNFMLLLQDFYLFPKQEAILKKYFPGAPPLAQIQSDKLDLMFVNAHFSNEYPRPNTPNIVYIGGYHVQKPEPLAPELKKFLDNAEEGVVFLAFGSNVDSSKLPKEKLDAFVNKFAKSPYKVLFKYDGELPSKPKNVETSSWYPQRAVLAHPNTKLFLSHGGRGSTVESLYFGVPTLCISFYGDQKKNCEDMKEYGYGIHLPYQEVTENTFEEAFDEITKNPKYKDNAKFRAALFQEQEMNPLDRANFWIEHVHKFKGAKHLQPISTTMPLYQYLLFDVWAFLITILGLFIFILYKSSKFILSLIFRKAKKIETRKKIKRN